MSRTSFFRNPDGYLSFWMDADEVLDVTADWSDLLGDDTILTHTSAGDGVTVDSDANTPTTTTVWLSGASRYSGSVTQTVVTVGGRTKQKTFRVYRRPA